MIKKTLLTCIATFGSFLATSSSFASDNLKPQIPWIKMCTERSFGTNYKMIYEAHSDSNLGFGNSESTSERLLVLTEVKNNDRDLSQDIYFTFNSENVTPIGFAPEALITTQSEKGDTLKLRIPTLKKLTTGLVIVDFNGTSYEFDCSFQ